MRPDIRLSDLQTRTPDDGILMNVRVPARIANAIDHISELLGASKREVFVALINEGLARAGAKSLRGKKS